MIIYTDGKKLKEWKSIDINYTASEIGVETTVILNNIPAFEEAIIITNIDSNVIKFDPTSNSVTSATYMHYTPGGIYDVAYDFHYERQANRISFRQTIKGSDAGFVTISKMFYR